MKASRYLSRKWSNNPAPLQIREAPDGERIILTFDGQFPFMDMKLWYKVLKFLEDYKPHWWVFGGDMLDFPGLSKFLVPVEHRLTTIQQIKAFREEVLETIEYMTPGRVYIFGNHEDHFERYLQTHAPELEGLYDLPTLLGLNKHGWLWQPYGGWMNYLGFIITHGSFVRKWAGNSARAEAKEMWGGSGASGHVHRLGVFRYRDARGLHAWYEGGCLCTLDPHYVKGLPDWHQGFLYGEVFGGKLHIMEAAVLNNGRFFANGKAY